MIDASLYNITVRKGNFDNEVFFEAKVKELPDVAEYAESYEEAYLLAIDTIETTAEALVEQGKVMPSPMIESDEFSGRVTLRMPKSMHGAYTHWAEEEEISLNQLLVNSLSYNLGIQFGKTQSLEQPEVNMGAVTETEFVSIVSERKRTSNVVHLKKTIEIGKTVQESTKYG